MLTEHQRKAYRHALEGYLGYVAHGHQASTFNRPAWEVLGWLLMNEEGHLDEFLTRYPRVERPRRKREVRQAIALWLAEMAGGIEP